MEVKKSKKANLENKKLLYREIGIAIALGIVLLAFEWPSYEKSLSMLDDNRTVVAEEEMIAVNEEPPPPPEQHVPIPQMQDEFQIVDDDVKVENILITSEDDKHLGVEIMDYKEKAVEEEVEDDIPFAVVEDKPKFQGGDENQFTKWVYQRLEYPESARENGVQGRVTVQFVITTDGRLTETKVIRGVDPAIDKEVVRVVSMSPRWTPGKQRGKPVRVKYVIPITFQLR